AGPLPFFTWGGGGIPGSGPARSPTPTSGQKPAPPGSAPFPRTLQSQRQKLKNRFHPALRSKHEIR
ncbi:MAG: hypothetical protein PHF57_10320, partial [Methanoregula sp.]|nr:hypothetical protein [Methanoregula sp.]